MRSGSNGLLRLPRLFLPCHFLLDGRDRLLDRRLLLRGFGDHGCRYDAGLLRKLAQCGADRLRRRRQKSFVSRFLFGCHRLILKPFNGNVQLFLVSFAQDR